MSRCYRFDQYVLDTSAYRVLRGATPLAITPKLIDVLVLLVEHAGNLVTKESLLEAVWPDANVTDNALAQAISELRQLLGDDPASPRFIKTVARRGYRFVAPVQVLDPPSRADSGPEPASPPPQPAVPSNVRQPARAIAVLDFANVTGDPDTAWLSAGIAETVTGDLRALGAFRTVDRRRVLEATASVGNALEAVSRATGAALVVVGSFQRIGSRIRITARMVDAEQGEAIADAKVDGPIDEIFALQDQIVIALAREMGTPLQQAGGSRIGARETSSLDAYRAFTSGWLHLETLEVDALPKAVDDFRRAIAIDDRYALARTGLASAEFAVYESTRSDNAPGRDLLDEAIQHARHAVALDDRLAEAHATLGFLLVSDWETAEAQAATRRAVSLEPGNWRHHFRLGHASWGEARLHAADATLALHPGFAFAHFQRAMVHVARGDLKRAASVLQDGAAVQDRQRVRRERFPALGLHWLLGLVHLALGEVDVAIADFDRELLVADVRFLYGREFIMHARLGRALALAAAPRLPEAIADCNAALALYPHHAPTHLALATIHAATGNRAQQTEHLSAVDAALGVLDRCKPVEAALVRSQRLAVDGAADRAIDVLDAMLQQAPAGFAGWTIPVEPLLRSARTRNGFARIEKALAQRAR